MLKQPAWAAAISSSGLLPALPSSFSNRALVEYGNSTRAPLRGVLRCPDPSSPVPFQTEYRNILVLGDAAYGALGMEGSLLAARQAMAWTEDNMKLKKTKGI